MDDHKGGLERFRTPFRYERESRKITSDFLNECQI